MSKHLLALFTPLAAYASRFLLAVFLLSIGSIYISRLPDSDQCIQIAVGDLMNTASTGLVDLVSGRYAVDRRPTSALGLDLPSPDGKWKLMLVKNHAGGNLYSYIIQAADGTSRTVLQDAVVRDVADTPFPLVVNPYFKWSPSSQFLVYIWKDSDDQAHLSRVRISDMQQQTVAYSRMDMDNGTINFSAQVGQGSNTIIQGWSGDESYLSIAERDKHGFGFRVSIWDTHDLEQLSTPFSERPLSQGMWLLRGTHYAAVTATRKPESPVASLVVFDAAGQSEISAVELPGRTVRLLSASPGHDYLALSSIVEACEGEVCSRSWQHELFDTDGKALSSIFRSSPVLTTDTAEPYIYTGAGGVYSHEAINGFWSADGQTWVYIQQMEGGLDLFRFDLATRQARRIAAHLDQEWFGLLLPNTLIGDTAFQSFDPIPLTLAYDFILVPSQTNPTVRIDLLDIPRDHVTPVLEGAAKMIRDNNVGFLRAVWSFDSAWVMIPWITADDETRLTLVRIDDAQVTTLDKALTTTSSVRWVNEHWISYKVSQGDKQADIEILNVDSLLSKTLITGVDDPIDWYVVFSPQSDYLTLYLTNTASYSYADVWLIALDGELRQQLNIQRNSYGIWSADGSQMAYISGLSERNRQLEILDVHHNLLRQIPIREKFNSRPNPQGWTKCY